VSRIGFLLFVLLVVPAHAQQPLDTRLVTDVYATALAFLAPRTLEPISVAQMTLWGLRGLTTLDPSLTTEAKDGKLNLSLLDRVVATRQPPPPGDITGWANAAAGLAIAATTFSPTVRRAGSQAIIQSFFDEMFNHLDPYSRYVPPRAASEDREQRSGSAGAGLELIQRGTSIVVQDAISDAPAGLAGIRPGDTIVGVDGRSTRGKDARTVAAWIEGPEDTAVTIAWRTRDSRLHTAELVRAMVPPETVFAQHIGSALLVRLTGFNRSTDAHLLRVLAQELAAPHPPDGIVLDLRGNRGGLLAQATAAADDLLPAGIVAMTVGRDPEATRVWRSDTEEVAVDFPIVVLVDGRTASAAEVLAAALADRGRAVVVGSSTLGKGLVQTISPLPDGGELFVTWSRVLAPLGWPIQGLGVMPQVCTSLGQDSLGWQLATLGQGRQPMAQALVLHNTARAPLPPAQMLAIRSACPAAEARDSDLDVARFLIRNPAAYASALLPPLRETGEQPMAGAPAGTR
jgi:carboxyl-terminal processing protease